LDGLVRDAWTAIPTKNATLETSEIDDVTLYGARQQFVQMLENLLSNAVEHGGDAITIRVGVLDGGDGF
jgi:signal transduction histidine kinase